MDQGLRDEFRTNEQWKHVKNISKFGVPMFRLGLVSTFGTPIKSFGVGPEVSKTPAQEEVVSYEMHWNAWNE